MSVHRYAVVGNPVKHSKSPDIHALFAKQCHQGMQYTKLELPLDGFLDGIKDFFSMADNKGLNVTVPFKESAFDACEVLSDRARKAGAVNTLFLDENGALNGDTTDGVGLVRDLVENHDLVLKGKKILVIGAGGAVRGVLQPILEEAPEKVTVCNRTLSKVDTLVSLFSDSGTIEKKSFESLTSDLQDSAMSQNISPLPNFEKQGQHSKIAFINSSDTPMERKLVLRNANLNFVDVWLVQDSRLVSIHHFGEHRALQDRSNNKRFPTISFTLPAHSTLFAYIQIIDDSVVPIGAELSPPDLADREEIVGIAFGVSAIFLLLLCTLFATLYHVTRHHYALVGFPILTFGLASYFLATNGFINAYLAQNNLWLQEFAIILGLACYIGGSSWLTINYLRLSEKSKGLRNFYGAITALSITTFLIYLAGVSFATSVIIYALLLLSFMATTFTLISLKLSEGDFRYTRYFFVYFILIAVGGITCVATVGLSSDFVFSIEMFEMAALTHVLLLGYDVFLKNKGKAPKALSLAYA